MNITLDRNTSKILEKAIEIIVRYKNPMKIILYGSRARNDFKRSSDVDLAILSNNWQQIDVNIIKSRLNEEIKTLSDFDLINLKLIKNEELKKNILKDGIIIYESGKN